MKCHPKSKRPNQRQFDRIIYISKSIKNQKASPRTIMPLLKKNHEINPDCLDAEIKQKGVVFKDLFAD
jgi:hypothetical protein